MDKMSTPRFRATSLHFEHYASPDRIGIGETRPRLSWKFENAPDNFKQARYQIQTHTSPVPDCSAPDHDEVVESNQNVLVEWSLPSPLSSRAYVSARVRCWSEKGEESDWSSYASVECGLLERDLWTAKRIASPWEYSSTEPQPEELFTKEFKTSCEKNLEKARLYITAQGTYEASINGVRLGDHFLAPGWTVYDRRLRYQTFDVLPLLSQTSDYNVIGVRLAEGWFCGRLSWGSGFSRLWGDRPALIAQLEMTYSDGSVEVTSTDTTWKVARGPTTRAEIYDGEKYDARLELPAWSDNTDLGARTRGTWSDAVTLTDLSPTIELVADEAEPVRRISVVQAIKKLISPAGKTILDFGQNLVGYIRIKHVKGNAGDVVRVSHAEVMEDGELGRRPLRSAQNIDEYTLKGCLAGESWEPSFTFHGFRYVQVDGWPVGEGAGDLQHDIEAVVCHTDMRRIGQFTCSDPLLNQLHQNIVWSMRGNFLSIPTDCPQRDERLGWTGDLALFAPTASRLYDCTSMLTGWLKDVYSEQQKYNGVPPMVVPNVLEKDPMFGTVRPAAIWSDVTVLAPWALYQATGDQRILQDQYESMTAWLSTIPKNPEGSNTHLWEQSSPQLGDWLDPAAPPENPAGGRTDAVLVADCFLVHSLDIVKEVAKIIRRPDDAARYSAEAEMARTQFAREYMTPNGRLMSDSQTAYSLGLVFDLFPSQDQRCKAADRLSWLVRRNQFKIATGFAGTPFVCEALAQSGSPEVAYAMLFNRQCPSWLYPVTIGATTIWERWDSMLADGSINPGEMTSFNHYAFGSVANFIWDHLAGITSAEPGWKKIRIQPVVGGGVTHASAKIETPYGTASSSWRLLEDKDDIDSGTKTIILDIVVPPNTSAEVVFPIDSGKTPQMIGSGAFAFSFSSKTTLWPVEPLSLW